MRATAGPRTLLCLTLLLPALAAPGRTDTGEGPRQGRRDGAGPVAVPEIRPGLLQGYLDEEQRIDSLRFVPPPPSAGSPRQVFDDATGWEMLKLRGSPRWNLARSDADLSFPFVAGVFSCALGIPVSEPATPALVLLLRRSMTDIGLSTYSAKNGYQRKRPFMQTGTPICTPEDAAELREDGSYPSGHTAIGWGWALILAELMPERAEEILARGIAFGESRNVCNVHWASDVEAGRLVGAAAVTQLQDVPAFQADLRAARAEIERVRAQGLTPQRACAAEEAALTGDPAPAR